MAEAPENADNRLARLRRRAALALLWEDLWPPLAAAGGVALLFAAVSWFGLWFEIPSYARLAGLALFGLALLAALTPLIWVRWPGSLRALRRLDRDSPVAHGPATALQDTLATPGDDPTTRALWAMHKARVADDVARLRVAAPAPNLAARDPYALRFVAVLLALVGAFAAGSERFARLAAAFHGMPTIAASAAPARVDAWIDPPAYTGKPPIFLKVGEEPAEKRVEAPEGSTLAVRADPNAVGVSVSGALTPAPNAPAGERRFAIRGDGEARLRSGGFQVADILIKAAPRTNPSIRLMEPPQANASGSMTLHYKIDDAYGVKSAEGAVALSAPDGAAASAPKHTLFGPPTIALSLPGGANGVGEGRATVDLAEHPWAGAHVALTLKAVSVSGANAVSPVVETVLPQKRFVNPLARALVELRRDLVLDPDRNRPRVARALDALNLGPELFNESPRVYLSLDGVSRRLGSARNDDDLREVAAWLWSLALSIESGDASQALKDLRAAEDKLREALRNNASPEELKALMQKLRDAAQRYLAETMKNTDKQAMEDEAPADSKDLDAMLDKLEKDADSGAKDDAQAMLDELQETMENLRSAEKQKSDPAGQQMRQALKDLDKLQKDQQVLRDDTFRQDQKERSGAPENSDGKQSLKDRQKALRDRLKEVEKNLRGKGVDTPDNLKDAEGDMSDAEKHLNEGEGEGDGDSQPRFGHSQKGEAVESQGKAVEALREGGQSMRRQMRGRGGKGGYVGLPGGRKGQNDDPLGRGQDGVKGAAEGQLSGGPDSAARARRVLDELRRRLADPNRPSEERDYLERLIGQP